MPGGLLNIIAYGNQNVFLHGNPDKTFFKSSTEFVGSFIKELKSSLS